MIWKRRDTEFAEKTCRRKPLRSPRLRVSNLDTTQTRTILKTQRHRDHRGSIEPKLRVLRASVFLRLQWLTYQTISEV